jgi:hypothetical protein
MTNPDGTKRTGSIQSSNYEEGKSGFRIRWDGDVEFNEGIFRSHLFARSLEAGPLSVFPSAPKTITRNFPTSETAENIYNDVRTTGAWDATGDYNGAITRVEVAQSGSSNTDRYDQITTVITEVYIYRETARTLIAKTTVVMIFNMLTQAFTRTVTHNNRTSYPLTFNIALPAMTMELHNLPEIPNVPTVPGTVYRDGNRLCIV